MSDTDPRVSVIIPTYNRAGILPRAIDSVLAQTFEDLELIVVDDASTDETEAVVRGYDDSRVVYLCHEENSGNGGIARNTGISEASGEYVAFLDDDDRWLPTKIEKQLDVFYRSTVRVGLVYTWMDYYDGEEVIKKSHPEHRGDIFREMLDRNAITSASTIMTRMDVLKEVGGFDPEIPRGVDSDWIRRVSQHYYVDYVAEVLVEYNVGHGYERDSAWDEAGLRAAIESTNMRLDRFESAYEQYPEKKASSLAYIGAAYAMLGDVRLAVSYFSEAIRTAPFALTVYVHSLRVGKFFVDRHAPKLGRLIDKAVKT